MNRFIIIIVCLMAGMIALYLLYLFFNSEKCEYDVYHGGIKIDIAINYYCRSYAERGAYYKCVAGPCE